MRSKIITLISVFIVAFLTNCLWEFLHAYLYVHYRGEAITSGVLVRAALFDALVITILLLPAIIGGFLKKYLRGAVFFAVLFAVALERFALSTDRWAYTDAMPIVPIIHTGLTPTIQLGVLSILTFAVVSYTTARHHRVVPDR